jgi:hypothetical protein
MNDLRRDVLVLSLYLNSRGLSFILFEGTLSPYDWGIFESRGVMKDRQVLDKVNRLFDRYFPDVLVMQDMGPGGTRRASRLEALNGAIGIVARQRGVPVFAYSRAEVYSAFASQGFTNKQTLAGLIAKHIPAFERLIPPPRKPWMSEDARMGLFDAAALAALLFFQKAGRTSAA